MSRVSRFSQPSATCCRKRREVLITRIRCLCLNKRQKSNYFICLEFQGSLSRRQLVAVNGVRSL
ncbi:hypothetical protein [Faecalispora jeddahensis]|uniref:hypothetical protein n=1 Tax=Faecalispora jeddahensis TaxID=1414721 RepID=UPI00398CCCDF